MPDDASRWQIAMTVIEGEVRTWRRAHPDATLTEIEQTLDTRLDPVRAALLAEVAGDAPDDAARCPDCGERLRPRGTRTRTLRTAGDATRALTRPYLTCPVCRSGLSPLDERPR